MGCVLCCCRRSEMRQTKLLVKKQFRLAWRSKWTTGIQVFAPLLFSIILVILQVSLQNQVGQDGEVVRSFPVASVPTIPKCMPSVISSAPCITIAFVPNDATLQAIIQEILNEAGINETPMGFATAADLDNFLANNRNRTQGAYIFNQPSPIPANFVSSNFDYVVQYNTTQFCKLEKCSNPQADVLAPMQFAMDKKIWERNFGANKLSVSVREYPRLELFAVDVIKEYGIFFYFLTYMFIFIVASGNIVMEKESQLRENMRLAGLRNTPFWLSWFIQQFVLVLCTTLVLVTSGAMCQFDFFLKNNFGTYFLLFLLFGISITVVGFMMTTFIQKSRLATPMGFLVFIIFYFIASIVGDIYPIVSEGFRQLFAFFPPVLFAKGLTDLGNASSGDLDSGLSFSDISSYTDIWPLSQLYWWLILDTFLYGILTWYFDHILPGPNGVSRSCFFFLSPSYLCNKPCRRKTASAEEKQRKWLPLTSELPPEDDTVKRHRLQLLEDEGLLDPSEAGAEMPELQRDSSHQRPEHAIRVMNLVKQFGKKRSTVAVRRLYMGVPKGLLFCLLGPNGAGKTTTISMLTGMLPPTSGVAEINGMSVYNELEEIHRVIGVCPQFDLLWPQLTAYEHLELFTVLRGIPDDKVESEVKTRLEQVGLWDVRDDISSSFSGGMKRRLSVAISLVGDPKIVFLDEPTTGMDPVMRRKVWDMIELAKRDRTIVLTTHSMEEADILGDEIAIMAKGRMRAVGSSLQLKNRFGTGYQLRVSAQPDLLDDVAQFVCELIPDARLVSNLGGFLTFAVPREKTLEMPNVFRALKANAERFQLRNYSVQQSTLEDVFLEIVDRAKKEEKRDLLASGEKKKKKKSAKQKKGEKPSAAAGEEGVEMQELGARLHPERVQLGSSSSGTASRPGSAVSGNHPISHQQVRVNSNHRQ